MQHRHAVLFYQLKLNISKCSLLKCQDCCEVYKPARTAMQYLLVSKWAEVNSGNSVLTITPHASEPDTILAGPQNASSTCGICAFLIWTNSLFGPAYVWQQTDELSYWAACQWDTVVARDNREGGRGCDGTGQLSPSAFARACCPFEQKSLAYAAA